MPQYIVRVRDPGGPVNGFSLRHETGCYNGCAQDTIGGATEGGTWNTLFLEGDRHFIRWDAQSLDDGNTYYRAGRRRGRRITVPFTSIYHIEVNINLPAPIPAEEIEEEGAQQGAEMGAEAGAIFGELLSHECGSPCKTKDTPCERHVLGDGYCYQHRGIA